MRAAQDAAEMVKADLIRRATAATTLESPAAREAVDAPFESVASAITKKPAR